MKAMKELREKLHVELDEISRKPDMGIGDLEIIHKLTDTIKNIDKICMMQENGYSEDGYSRMYPMDGGDYSGRRHYVRAHYSRDDGRSVRDGRDMYAHDDGMDGYSGRRDSRGRYSRDAGRSEMMEHLEMALDSANEQDRETIKRFMAKMEQM